MEESQKSQSQEGVFGKPSGDVIIQSSSSKSLAPLDALDWTTEQIPVKCLGNTKVLHPGLGLYMIFTRICLLDSRTSSFVTIPASSTGKW